MSDDATPVSEPYPLDVWKLEKGQYLDPAFCERCIGARFSDRGLALLNLRSFIQTEWRDKRGEIVTVTREHDGLRIHTDETAVDANQRLFDHAKNKVRRSIVQTRGIDRANLSPCGRSAHERLQVRLAAYKAGARRAERAALRPHVRQTPAALPPSEVK